MFIKSLINIAQALPSMGSDGHLRGYIYIYPHTYTYLFKFIVKRLSSISLKGCEVHCDSVISRRIQAYLYTRNCYEA